MRRRTATSEEILKIGQDMVDYDWRLHDVSANLGIALSTVHKWVTQDLKYINYEQYTLCRQMIERHKHERIPRGRRY